MLVPSKIILHCSATNDTDSLSWEAIRRYHVDRRGWKDIGYHYGIEYVDGGVHLLRGRPWFEKGAHCKAAGRNFDSLGVCTVGKFETPPPADIYQATVRVLSTLCYTFWVSPDDVYGHREFEKYKTCPGAGWDLDKLRADIRALWSDNMPHQASYRIGGLP